MKLGDMVRLENGETARIVCDYDRREFSAEYPESEWGDAAQGGILVKAEGGALVRLDRADVIPHLATQADGDTIGRMTDQLATDVHIVRVVMTGAQPGELGASQLWYAAVPRDKALERVKDMIPPGWDAELTDGPLPAETITRFKIKAGDVGELSSAAL